MISRSLRKLYKDKLTSEEVCALTDFVICSADKTMDSKEGSGTISLDEWFNCFTDDKCNFEMLRKIIESGVLAPLGYHSFGPPDVPLPSQRPALGP